MDTYIGLDAHSTTCTFVSLDSKGKIVKEAKVATTERNLVSFIRGHKGKTSLVFEESSLSKWLYATIKEEVSELVVCNPIFLGKRVSAKHDRNDAHHLANELRCGHVVPVFHDQSEIMELRSLIGGYKDLVQEMVRAKNRYKALFRSQAIATSGSKIYGAEERIQELSGKVDQFVAKRLFDQIAHLETTKSYYRDQFESNMKKISILKKLDTVPGVDAVRAHVIAACIASGHRFRNKHKLWSYAMLVKHIGESDGQIYSKSTRFGKMDLKEAFIGIAESALMGNSSLRKQYDRMRSDGASHMDAKFAVARRAAAICLQIMKRGTEYDERFEEKKESIKKVIV